MDMANKPTAVGAESGHEETYDEWFIRQVNEALAEADDPSTEWIPHEEVMRDVVLRREELLARLKKNA